MAYRLAADSVAIVHLLFVVFVVLGALLVLRWRWIGALHVPAALWGTALELFGLGCPLTPLEQRLRRLAGEQGYSGGFIDHYIVSALYPAGLEETTQRALGVLVVLVNLATYGWVIARRRRAQAQATLASVVDSAPRSKVER